jgi:hypothetical protein
MDNVIPGLYASTPEPLGFGPSLEIRAFLLQRERGKGHHAAFRALAFKWIRILFRCWKDRVPYDEDRYLRALRRRGSPLIHRLGAARVAS